MPKTTTTTVNQNEAGQYTVTVPRAFGDALELDGRKVVWEIISANKLAFEPSDD